MKTQIKHEESGCTDYLQHPWESCPENKGYTRDECETLANMVKSNPEREPCGWIAIEYYEAVKSANAENLKQCAELIQDIIRIKAQRDELLAALKAIAISDADRFTLSDIAETAIANAEKGAQ